MTIQDLYIFACKQDLLNKDVYEVLNKFKASLHIDNINDSDDITIGIFGSKVEFTYEDVLELFSS